LRISAATAIDRATVVQISLHFVLFNLIYGTLMLVQGIELRRTARPCTSVSSPGGKRTRPEPGRAGVWR